MPLVRDGLPPLPADMTIGEMTYLINLKHAEIRQLERAIATRGLAPPRETKRWDVV